MSVVDIVDRHCLLGAEPLRQPALCQIEVVPHQVHLSYRQVGERHFLFALGVVADNDGIDPSLGQNSRDSSHVLVLGGGHPRLNRLYVGCVAGAAEQVFQCVRQVVEGQLPRRQHIAQAYLGGAYQGTKGLEGMGAVAQRCHESVLYIREEIDTHIVVRQQQNEVRQCLVSHQSVV